MVWKPREKEVPPEEAVAQARKEQEPYWFGSDPLLIAVDGGDGRVSALPLDPSITQGAWLFCLLDPLDLAGETVLHFVREWDTRYRIHNIRFLIFFKQTYQFLKQRQRVNALIREGMNVRLPFVMDEGGRLGKSMDVLEYPAFILMKDKKEIFRFKSSEWRDKLELELQSFLRQVDPGLPLPPPFKSAKNFVLDLARMEFGIQSAPAYQPEWRWGAGGFQNVVRGGVPMQEGTFVRSAHTILRAREVDLSGQWTRDAERLMTRDPEAVLSFTSPGPRVSIIAESYSRSVDVPQIVVEVNGLPVYEAIAGPHLVLTENGQAILEAREPRLVHILGGLPEKERTITLRFPNAKSAPLGLFGLRFS